jgi:hypothetical protein
MVSQGNAANVLRILLEPLRDLDVWDPIPHLLIDGLDEGATTDVAPSQDGGQLGHSGVSSGAGGGAVTTS